MLCKSAAVLLLVVACAVSAIKRNQPNFVLVVTDDQDVVLDGMVPMNEVKRLLVEHGATFTNAFTTSPLCCPSRASILTGLYAHNHHTYNNFESGGCNGVVWQSLEHEALPVKLQEGGYETFFAGKYINQYYGWRVPPGWNDWYGVHSDSKYFNYLIHENGKNRYYPNEYMTDVLRDKALAFLDRRNDTSKPFFVMITPHAAHDPFTPAPRHDGAYFNTKAVRTPNYNLTTSPADKHWHVSSASRPMSEATEDLMDVYYRKRWESLLSVDEMVADIVERLEDQGELDNTYVIYTSDNGFHIGQFAQPYDKRQPYETDIRVPLVIRGPTVPKRLAVNSPVALIDLMPSILKWANLPIGDTDGQPIQGFIRKAITCNEKLDRSLLIAHWGEGDYLTYNSQCPFKPTDFLSHCTVATNCHCQDVWNNTYSCVRHFHNDIDRLYCEFEDNVNFVEAYDVGVDPFEMNNLRHVWPASEIADYSLILEDLKQCAGESCRDVHHLSESIQKI